MIIKSLILSSIIFQSIGLTSLSDTFNNAVVRERVKPEKKVIASNELISLPELSEKPEIKNFATEPKANARHYILADPDSGTIFAKFDQKTQVPIASTTKIMTAIVALENYNLDEVVTVSYEASVQVGADAFLLPNEKITVLNLLNCLLIKSGNDAAYALAEHINNDDETGTRKFIDKMNEKAVSLGMQNTKYDDPAGLNVSGYSTAYDLYLITKYALKNQTFSEIVNKKSESVSDTDKSTWHALKNSNRLVAEYQYPGAIGVKTGFMPEAGHCLVGAAKRDGHTLIAVVLSTYLDTPSASADEARRLLDWGFANIEWK